MNLPRPALVVGLAAAALAGLFFLCFEQRIQRVDLPPTGPAAINPLYLLERTLQARGVQARSRPSFVLSDARPGPRDTIVLRVAPEAMDQESTNALLAWVAGGGHLLLPAPRSGTGGALMETLGVRAMELPAGDGIDDDTEDGAAPADDAEDAGAVAPPAGWCSRLRGEAAGEPLAACGRFLVRDGEMRGYDGDATIGYRIARGDVGSGVVTVGGLQALDNSTLARPAGRELAQFLLAPRLGQGSVHLVYGARVPPLPALMWRYGWRALVPACLALLAFLAWRAQRFGPIAPVRSDDRRALLDHVRASGQFAWRRGQARGLYQAVRDHFLARLARRRPALAALHGEARVLALAEALGVDPAQVRIALAPVGLHRPDVFIPSIATLVRMRTRF